MAKPDTNNNNGNGKNKSQDKVDGTHADDVLTGGTGDEKVGGSKGNDVVSGGAGDDKVKGGSDDDLVDGDAGNDAVNGGQGDDVAVFNAAENSGNRNFYDGGSGTDTLLIELTREEWMRDDVQQDIARFLAFITANTNPHSQQANATRFQFQAFDLETRRFEHLRLTVDGVELDPADEGVVAHNSSGTTSGEHDSVAGNAVDNAEVPDLIRTVVLVEPPPKGVLTFNDDGSYVYDPGNDFDYLAAGESEQVSFAFKVVDADYDEDTATVTINVTGTNDAPIANVDTGATGENTAVTIDVLANDTDVDASDTPHTVTQAAISSGDGAVAIVDNQVQWTPGADYDYLPAGETATVVIDYTISDGNGGEASSTASIAITGTNDAPTVAAADLTTVSEQDAAFTVDLLAGAADADSTAVLNAINVGEQDLKGGWSVDGNVLTIDPDYFDSLNNGEAETLSIKYQITDELGASVDQTLEFRIEGFTDAPDLHVAVADDQTRTNGIALVINVAPANDERVDIRFANIPAGAVILYQGHDVSASGIADALGELHALLILDPDSDAESDLQVIATGIDESGNPFGESAVQVVDVNYDVMEIEDTLTFGTQDQSMWSSDAPVIIDWHKYVPIIGDVAQVYNEDTGAWESASGSSPWSSGKFSLVSVALDSQEIFDEAIKGPQQILDDARETFEVASVAVDQAAAAAFDAAQDVFDDAVAAAESVFDRAASAANSAFSRATKLANETYNAAVLTANKIFDATISAGEDAAQAVLDLAQGAYNAAVSAANAALDVARDIRDAAHAADILNVLTAAIDAAYQVAVDIRNGAVNTAQDALDAAKDIFNDGADAAIAAAQTVFDAAISTATNVKNAALDSAQAVLDSAISVATTVKDGAIAAAQGVLDVAEAAYDAAQQAVFDAAKDVFDLAQGAFDTASDALNQVAFDARLDVEAEVFAQVGLKIDFALDLGSVDTNVEYKLTSVQQFNHTTDMLSLTPLLSNETSGGDVAFTTLSPNVKFATTLVYDAGAKFDIFVDGVLQVAGTTIFDLSPDADGISVNTTVGTGGYGENLDFAQAQGTIDENLATAEVGELVLFELDTTDLKPFTVPGLDTLTENILSIQLQLPTVATEGTQAGYTPDVFDEGDFISFDFSELTGSIMNLVNAKLDFSPEIMQEFGLQSLQDLPNLDAVIAEVGEAMMGTLFGALDGRATKQPIFLIDATDETSSALLHLNLIPNSVLEDTLTSDTATFGFYTSYGESNDVVKATIDIDQVVAVIINKVVEAILAAVTGGATAPLTTTLPDVNPLNLSFGLDTLMKVAEVPEATRDQINQYLDVTVGLETADFDVNSNLKFSQEFTLSIDDMSYFVTMEDGTEYVFAANEEGSLEIANASQHDANGDGQVDYDMQLIPTAMFSNNTDLRLGYGYVMDFLQASLKAGVSLPVGNLLQSAGLPAIPGLGSISLNMINVNLGPLLRIKGDLDVASADVFESRFAIDLGDAQVSSGLSIIDDKLVGTPGDDVLVGNQGNDILTGAGGNDRFVFADNSGIDLITDFDLDDIIDLTGVSGIASFADIHTMDGGAGNTHIDLGGGNGIMLIGIAESSLQETNFIV